MLVINYMNTQCIYNSVTCSNVVIGVYVITPFRIIDGLPIVMSTGNIVTQEVKVYGSIEMLSFLSCLQSIPLSINTVPTVHNKRR